MSRIIACFSVAVLLSVASGCGRDHTVPPRPAKSDAPAVNPQELAVDPLFKPFPHDDPKVVKLPSGVEYLDVAKGKTPHGKVLADGMKCRVGYAGWMEDGKRFDASFNKPQFTEEFNMAKGQMIEGFLEGALGMQEGDRRLIFIPWAKAYGEGGNPGGHIPPKSNLIFDLALWEIIGEVAKAPVHDDAADHAIEKH